MKKQKLEKKELAPETAELFAAVFQNMYNIFRYFQFKGEQGEWLRTEDLKCLYYAAESYMKAYERTGGNIKIRCLVPLKKEDEQ